MKKNPPLVILAMFFLPCVMAQTMNVSELKENAAQKLSQSEMNIASSFVCGESQISDYDGNTYNTVKIGKQCWMRENLKTTHYSDGTYIEASVSMDVNYQYRFSPQNEPAHVASRGYLYNWTAVTRDKFNTSFLNPSGIQGVCPTGWHVPSDEEWTELTAYLSSHSEYTCDTKSQHISPDVYKHYIAKAMAATTGWRSSKHKCAIGYKMEENNASGFSALPAGQYTGFEGYDNYGEVAAFWSCTQQDLGNAFYRRLHFDEEFVSGSGIGKTGIKQQENDIAISKIDGGCISKTVGCSVRCLKD
ncbi:MAG: fibrobacter succinogenes major paralogous domain-containing protein [Bacteroidales bacterium]|nr:fibrobacter succinogenes major paralogous domain-containing protein [Bacteroidales bacterium]